MLIIIVKDSEESEQYILLLCIRQYFRSIYIEISIMLLIIIDIIILFKILVVF